jgi:hypothetical protein
LPSKRCHTFRKPTETISDVAGSGRGGYTCTIVNDFDTDLMSIARQTDRTVLSTAVPDDIRHSFTHCPRESRFNCCWQVVYTALVTFVVVGDAGAGRVQDFLGRMQFA